MSVDSKNTVKKRKRGIRASRSKLEKALLAAGFKTQASLAEKIAQLEKSDSAPKDLVNKVFREASVSPSSVQRIANALKVEAYTLYKTQKEQDEPNSATLTRYSEPGDHEGQVSKDDVIKPAFTDLKIRKPLIYGALLTLLVSALVWSAYSYQGQDSKDRSSELIKLESMFPQLQSSLGKFSMTILHEDKLSGLTRGLRSRIASSVNLTSNVSSVLPAILNKSLSDIAADYQVDFVLKLETKIRGRYQAVNAYLYAVDKEFLIWSDISSLSHFELSLNDKVYSLSKSVEVALGLSDAEVAVPQINPAVQDYYLEGMKLLDGSQNQLNIKSAQRRFSNAATLSPLFAEAHAGMCESYLLESWTSNEKLMLENASQACSQAVSLSPENDYVVATQSFLLRKTGRIDEAIEILQEQLSKSTNNVNLHYALAYVNFEAHYQHPENPTYLNSAKQNVQLAIAIEPSFWKPHFVLANIEWASRNIEKAILASEAAYNVDKNELVLSNLGVFNLCAGNLKDASKYFRESILLAPDSYLGYEMLGTALFFSDNFNESLASKLKAIELSGDSNIHQIWGSLADSYVHTGNSELAVTSFNRALEVIEADIARGNTVISDQAYQIYYLHKNARLQKDNIELNKLATSQLNNAKFDMSELDGSASLKMAIVFYEREMLEQANTFFANAKLTCPMYSKHPDIRGLERN